MNIYTPQHKYIDCQNFRKVLICGDVHGYYQVLLEKLAEVGFCPESDLLICLGDIIDRGPDSIALLSFFRDNIGSLCLMGNHELEMRDTMFKGRFGPNNEPLCESGLTWDYNGGDWQKKWSRALLTEFAEWIDELPTAMTLKTKHQTVGLSHTFSDCLDWDDVVGLNEFSEEDRIKRKVSTRDLLWSRTRQEAWNAKPIKGIDVTIHGHTNVKQPIWSSNSLFIDTEAGFPFGSLTVIDLNEKPLVPGSIVESL